MQPSRITITHAKAIAGTAAVFLAAMLAFGESLGAQEAKRWHGSLGIAVGSVEDYYGRDARRTLAVPLVSMRYREWIGIGASGAGRIGGGVYAYVKRGVVDVAFGLRGIESRPETRANALAGMDDRDGAAFATMGFAARAGLATLTATTAIGVTRDAGAMQMLGVDVGGRVMQRLTARLGWSATFANRENMRFDFGITDVQAARRRALLKAGDKRLRLGDTAAFAPSAGLKEVRGTLQAAYALGGALHLVGLTSLGHLRNDAKDSPLARRRSALAVALGLTRSF